VTRAATYIALLGFFLAAVAAAAGVVAAQRYGSGAYKASAVAATLIWVAGSASLALLASARSPASRLNSILGAMLLRMALPLATLVYLNSIDHSLLRSGLAGLIVIHYLAGLTLETLLAVRLVGSIKAPGSAGGLDEATVH
jgi:hypothetical protein